MLIRLLFFKKKNPAIVLINTLTIVLHSGQINIRRNHVFRLENF